MARDHRVVVSAHVDAVIAERFGTERSGSGRPSLYDFETGPLAAARLAFARFESLSRAVGPSVRSVTITDVFFGAVVFTGVLIDTDLVEIADVGIDHEYWDFVDRDPAD